MPSLTFKITGLLEFGKIGGWHVKRCVVVDKSYELVNRVMRKRQESGGVLAKRGAVDDVAQLSRQPISH